MDLALLLAGLPVAVALAVAGVFLMAQGLALLGILLLVIGILGAMFCFGGGMPRPDVVPRPGEEREY